jgi:hypothetical protein
MAGLPFDSCPNVRRRHLICVTLLLAQVMIDGSVSKLYKLRHEQTAYDHDRDGKQYVFYGDSLPHGVQHVVIL